MTGLRSYRSGLAAETGVERHYGAQGATILERRWRGGGGEVDLIVEAEGTLVFVEVKRGRTLESAAQKLSQAQQGRIVAAASAYLASVPTGQDTPCRFDAALVDATGLIEIVENAFS